tara:strand:+ start:600 stop:995 length:396 start_codon:yes stop_codon:yes gene_type:complete
MRKQSGAELSFQFWEQAESERLVRPVCSSCGENFFSPQVLCPNCHLDTWEYQESSGEGSIYSFTVIHRPPDSNFPIPLIVADIELDEGWRMFSWIVDCLPTEVDLGARVKVNFMDFSGRKLPVFTLKKKTT